MSGRPIFHLSFPVRDLDEAIAFYTSTLPGRLGRRGAQWADVALFGAQLTLQNDPASVTTPMPRSRHFGATLPWGEWETVTAALSAFVEPPALRFENSVDEQGKAMIADPSGNLIELKSYRHPAHVLPGLAT